MVAVALQCLIAWLFKLSVLVRLVSDSILVGFKAGAGLTIIMSQLPRPVRRGRRRGTTSSSVRSGLQVNLARSICSYWQSESLRS